MTRSIVKLPSDIDDQDFEVYVNGVPQEENVDFYIDRCALVFDRRLRQDRISGWRSFLGAWGISTYRQDDTVDIRYQADGEMHVKHALPITPRQ